MVTLGETLFNLQGVAGLNGRLRKLIDDDLESAVAELEAARLLRRSGVMFRFVNPSGIKRQDYEADLTLPSGRGAACEVKSKSAATALSRNTIRNSLQEARKQTPSDIPLVIFLRLPETWIGDPRLKELVEAEFNKFFRSAARAIAIVVFWDEWHRQESGALLRLGKFLEYPNYSSSHFALDDLYLIRPGISQSAGWIDFRALVEAELGSLFRKGGKPS